MIKVEIETKEYNTYISNKGYKYINPITEIKEFENLEDALKYENETGLAIISYWKEN